jgi:predicted helicase
MSLDLDKQYIYIRVHESYDKYDACKLGKTDNIPSRDSHYATSEIKRGKFIRVYELTNMHMVETFLKEYYKQSNIKLDGGIEFFNKTIINTIENVLKEVLKISFKKLTDNEIDCLVRKQYNKDTLNKTNTISKKNIIYTPRNDQIEIIDICNSYFKENNKGILALMCGVGKTLVSLWVMINLQCNTVLVGVPNILLLKQWEKQINILFGNIPYLIVSSGVTQKQIIDFLEKNKLKCFVITTYSSSHKIYKAIKICNFTFDSKIFDEVHHLTSNNFLDNKNSYVKILKIPSKIQLSLTATLKILENNENVRDDNIIISNDNAEFFGNVIFKRGLLWAIQNNIICDYNIQTIITDEEKLEDIFIQFNITEDTNKRLFLSAYSSLQSIYTNHSHHILVYANTMESSKKIIYYIKKLLEYNYFNIDNIYYSNYDSGMRKDCKKNILYQFEKSYYGILTCVYCLGEGWDFPLLNGVVFSENMTSNIRIVQCALRASRKDKNNKDKITNIILPILNRDDWLEKQDNVDLKKVQEVIFQLGLEDKTICQKIKVIKLKIEEKKYKSIQNKDTICELGVYDDELTKKIRLKTTKRTVFLTSFEKAKQIIKQNNVTTKSDYFELCRRDNRLSINPKEQYNAKFINWINYLSIEKKYYSLDECKQYVIHYLNEDINNYKHLDLSIIIKNLCIKDPKFPPNDLWDEYYNIANLNDIFKINIKKKKSGAIV